MKVLVVEDDFVSRRVLQAMFEKSADVDVAEDGKVALERIRKSYASGTGYDLVTLDIMLPEVDGYEVLKELRRLEETPRVGSNQAAKVIATSALSDGKAILKAFRNQAEAYLIKPIGRADLNDKLEELGFEIRV
ncbi:MAG: response regulator [Deltaproteobacteria bacterium]|nr:response regulator [Deltaproteobacteria bacterium]